MVTIIGEFRVSLDLSPPPMQISRLKHISHHFTAHYLKTIVKPLVCEGKPVSLRVVDWAAINYSKQYPICYVVSDANGNQSMFSMNRSYQQWLKTWRRRAFDIFRRKERIFFEVDGTTIETTVAQLNFILWMKLNNVLEWCAQNKTEIEQNMLTTLTAAKAARKANLRKKRSELVKSHKRTHVTAESRNIVFDK